MNTVNNLKEMGVNMFAFYQFEVFLREKKHFAPKPTRGGLVLGLGDAPAPAWPVKQLCVISVEKLPACLQGPVSA